MTRIVENPAFAGQAPRPLTPACHDGSPFLTIRHGCGADMHLHETQIDALSPDTTIATSCHGCDDMLTMPVDEVRKAFAQMREVGWYE